MFKTFATGAFVILLAAGAIILQPQDASADECWYEGYGLRQDGTWGCLGTPCPGGWCCKICPE